MLTVRFDLLSPLSHSAFGADAGNAVPLRRFPVVSIPDRPRIAAVSGNAIRGLLRRALMRELFDSLELGPEIDHWDRIYAALANGGTIEAAEKRLEPARIRAVREAIPALSVLGAALYTWLLPGHCSVGIAWPVCRETVTAGLVSERNDAPSMSEIEEEYTTTRLPDTDQVDTERSGVSPMPVVVEVISSGVQLESRMRFARHASPVERAAIAHGITLLDSLGGKTAQGLGRFRATLDGGEDDANPGPYRAWLADESSREAARAVVLALPDTW